MDALPGKYPITRTVISPTKHLILFPFLNASSRRLQPKHFPLLPSFNFLFSSSSLRRQDRRKGHLCPLFTLPIIYPTPNPTSSFHPISTAFFLSLQGHAHHIIPIPHSKTSRKSEEDKKRKRKRKKEDEQSTRGKYIQQSIDFT